VNPVSAYPLQACNDCKQLLISNQGSGSVMSSLRSLILGSRMIVDFCFRIFWSLKGTRAAKPRLALDGDSAVRQLNHKDSLSTGNY
jgi:hypothetical protein